MSTTAYPPNGASQRRAAVAIRRFVNDEIASRASRFDRDDGDAFAFVCECGDLACKGIVKMTLVTYGSSAPGSVVGH